MFIENRNVRFGGKGGEDMLEIFTSSKSVEWATPQALFDAWDAKYHFTLDPCATKENTKCKKYYTIKEDGLIQDWSKDIVFMNPPYGREIKKWIKKAYEESIKGACVVCLIPARTDTSYWHDFIFCNSWVDIFFIRGRVKFGTSKSSAPFSSAIVVFDKERRIMDERTNCSYYERKGIDSD